MSDNNILFDTESLKGVSMALLIVLSTVSGLPLLAGSAVAAGTTDVTADPSSATLLPNETQTFVITVPNASDGVGTYDFNFSVGSSVAEITAVSDLTGGDNTTTVSSDGSSANIKAINANTANGSVDVIEVTVETVAPGSTSLDVTVNELADNTGEFESYTVQSVTDPSITVQDPVDFQVSNITAPSSAETGESITVSATVQNEGVQQGTQTVEFSLDRTGVASKSVTLNPNESTTVRFNVDAPTSTGTFTHGVFTDDDNATASLTVTAPSSLSVQPGSISPDAGDENTTVTHTLTFEALEVSDDGNTDTFTVIFPDSVDLSPNNVSVVDEDGNVPASGITGGPNVVDLANGSNAGIQFSVSPDSSQNVRNLTFTVDVDVTFPEVSSDTTVGIDARANDSSSDSDQAQVASVTINDTTESPDPANFQVSNLTAPSSAEVETEVSVNATVTNTGDQQATETVQFRFDGSNISSQTVNLDPGESNTVTFTTTPGSTGTLTHGVFTDNDSQTAQIEVTSGTTSDVSVSLQPASQDLTVGQNATYDIVADNVPNGVTFFNVNVSSSDASVVEILSVSLAGSPFDDGDPIVAPDGSSASLRALYSTSLSSDSTVTLGAVTVNGSALGSVDLTLQVTNIGDADGNIYNISDVSGSTANVNPQDAPDNLTLTEPSTPEEFNFDSKDQLQIAYEYTENQTGTATVQLSQDGRVVAEAAVNESAYTDDGTVKSFGLDLVDSFDVSTLEDGRYNVTLIVTNEQGGTATASTSNAPVAINDQDDVVANVQQTDSAFTTNTSDQSVTVNISYNATLPADPGDIAGGLAGPGDEAGESLQSVRFRFDGEVIVSFYDESREEYRTVTVDVGNSGQNTSYVEGQLVTETLSVDLSSQIQSIVASEDRLLTADFELQNARVRPIDDEEPVGPQVEILPPSDDTEPVAEQQNERRPTIDSVEVIGADVDPTSTQLRITFTRPVSEQIGQDLSAEDFAYQDVSGDETNFVTSVSDVDGDTEIVVTLDSAVAPGDVGTDLLSLQDDTVLENPTSGLAVLTQNATLQETDAPQITDTSVDSTNASRVVVTFDQPVEAGDGSALSAANFSFSGSASVTDVQHEAGDEAATLVLSDPIADSELGSADVSAAGGEVFDRFGNSQALSEVVDDETAPFDIAISQPNTRIIKQSTDLLNITYRYTENVPSNVDSVTVSLVPEDSGDSITYQIDDSQYVDAGTNKSLTIDLNSVVSEQLPDDEYSVRLTVTDGSGNTDSEATEPLVIINDEQPEISDVTVSPRNDVAPDNNVTVSYDYSDATDATSVTVHIVAADTDNAFERGDFDDATFAQREFDVSHGSGTQTVQIDLSAISIIQDNEDFQIFVTATDESGFTNLNTSNDPIIEGPVSSTSLDINEDAPSISSVEANAGESTVVVTFSEAVTSADSTAVGLSDFAYQDVTGEGASSIVSVQGLSSTQFALTLDANVSVADLQSDLISVRTGEIEDTDGANARVVTSGQAVALTDTTKPDVPQITADDISLNNEGEYEITVNTTAELTNVELAVSDGNTTLTNVTTNTTTSGISDVDVVFVFDDSGSMAEEISGARSALLNFTRTLESDGSDVRVGLVTFKDDAEIDQALTGNVSEVRDALNRTFATGGGDVPEDSLDAIDTGLGLDRRSDAETTIIHVTDASVHFDGDGSGFTDLTIEEVADNLNAQNSNYILVGPESSSSDPRAEPTELVNQTDDSRFIDIDSGNFATLLENEVATAVTNLSLAREGVKGEATFTLDASSLADGEDNINITARLTDLAATPQSSQNTVFRSKDTVAPTIQSAQADNGTRTVDVTFNETVIGFEQSDFNISSPNHSVVRAIDLGPQTVRLVLNRTVPGAAINNSDVTVSASGVTDGVGNAVPNSVRLTDTEPPTVSVNAERGSTTFNLTFSENISPGPNSTFTTSEFSYIDNSDSSAGSIESATQVGPQTIQLTLDSALTPSDLDADEIRISNDSVFDTAGNAVPQQVVAVDFQPQFDVTTSGQTITVQVTTSQNISDAVGTLTVAEVNRELAELEGFTLEERFVQNLTASDFQEVSSGVFEATVTAPEDGSYSVQGLALGQLRSEVVVVDTTAPEPTDATILSVTSEAQLDDSRDTTRIRVLFSEPIDASQISPDDITVEELDGEIVAVQDSGVFGAVEIIVEGDLQTGDSPEVSIAASSYTDLNGTQGVEDGSTVIHTDVVQLNEGVNLVSVPAASGSLEISELPLDAIESISRYNAETDSFEVFVPGAPNNPFTTLDGGEGYIIRLENGTTASVAINVANEPTGEGGPNSVDLSEGLNLIGHYQEDQQAVTTALSSVTAGQDGQFSDTVFTVLSQDEEAGGFTYESFRAGEFSTMEDGEAYWVFVTEDETYTEAPFDDR